MKLDLAARKEQLRAAARELDPLKPIREHPYLALGCAAVVGVVASSPGFSRMITTLARWAGKHAASETARRLAERVGGA